MAGLRLDTPESVLAPRPGGVPLFPGNPKKSLIYQRITHPEANRRMPPQHSHKKLNADQIDLIRQWIEEGGRWEEHWSFMPITRPQLPQVRDEEWVRNPIDRFILARLESEGLVPAPQADRRTLARRASLDITGLPPPPQQVERFAQEETTGAYEQLINRLMESKAYGEHRARYWLDAARYADTHGLHYDNYREMWPYRDWVIEAFNRNLPFDQFTVEQIAGDLLPNPTPSQVIATGFHRCNITTSEGGVIKAEVEAMYAKDRVDTTGSVWLGLTMGCATCHDHKFDPITQRDYYSMAAFFRNTTQPTLDQNFFATPPALLVPAQQDRQRWETSKAAESVARQRLEEIRSASKDDFRAWLDADRPDDVDLRRFDPSDRLWLELTDPPTARLVESSVPLELHGSASVNQTDLPFLNLPDESYLQIPIFRSLSADQSFTISIAFCVQEADKSGTLVDQTDYAQRGRGWNLNLINGLPQITLRVDWGWSLGIQATGERKVEPGRWHNLTVTYDGLRHRSSFRFYLDGVALPSKELGTAIGVLEGAIQTRSPLIIGANENRDGQKVSFLEGKLRQVRILERAVTEPEVRLLAVWDNLSESWDKRVDQLKEEEREALEWYYLTRHNPTFADSADQLQILQEELRTMQRRSAKTLVMAEKPASQPMAHILHRGMYDQERQQVGPQIPAFLPSIGDSLPRNRLGLAKWLVHDSNPLTSRVIVNRFWQEVFGIGLVKTSEDLGAQGETPSHPELLDWLAAEFRDSGWDVKHLFRLMLTSSTYRQSARSNPSKLEIDPENRLLSRGPRFRMDAEMIRDYALAASGLLVRKIGGRSVKPYQPQGLWEAVAMLNSNTRFYQQDSGEDLYRRSLYTFWKRAAPPPTLTIFDAPSREFCSVRRERTNTPLQALVTMNGPQFFEAARHLAQRAMHLRRELSDRLDFVASHLLLRPLLEQERGVIREAYADYLMFYQRDLEKARRMLSVGDSEPDTNLPKAEFAALTMTAHQLLNLDEVLTK